LPGSKGGVKDGLAVLVPLLRHILAVIDPTEAGLAEQASLHGPRVAPAPAQTTETAPVQDACCAHRHPVARHSSAFAHPRPGSTLVPSRQRHSPHVLVTLADALSRVHDVVDSLSGSLGTETRPLGASLQGHVLAEAVCATHDLPAWRSTNVDGYAVVAADGPAGERTVRPKGTRGPLRAGEVERVNTGGPVPDGADAVVMVEDTELVASSPDGSEETTIRLVDGAGSDVVKVGQHLRQPGSDLARGTQVMAAGERVGFGGGEVGVLASVGRRDVAVLRRPTIALLSTGNELVDLAASAGGTGEQAPPVGADGSWTGIYDSNRPALKAVAESMGYQVVDLGVVRDELRPHYPIPFCSWPVRKADSPWCCYGRPGAHEQAMRKGMELADVVITTGGTSMGEGDLVKVRSLLLPSP
jgi:gephyrin